MHVQTWLQLCSYCTVYSYTKFGRCTGVTCRSEAGRIVKCMSEELSHVRWKNCQVYFGRIGMCVYAGWKLSHLCRKEELSHVQYVENKLLSACKKNCHVLCMLEELLCVCQNYCHMLEYVGRTVKLISQKIVACMLEELSRVCRKKFHMYVGKISRVCLKKLSRVCHEYLGRIVTCSAGPCISSPKSLGTPALPRGRQPSLTSQEPVLNKLYSVFVFVIYRLPHC